MFKEQPSLGKTCHESVCRTAIAISRLGPLERGGMPSRFVDLMATLAGQYPNSGSWARALSEMKFLEMEATAARRAWANRVEESLE